MSKKDDLYLGIDIGGSAFKYGWGNTSKGLIASERLTLADNSLASMQAVSDDIIGRISTVIGLEKIKAIGIGTPGTINRKTGLLQGINPNLPDWTNLLPASLISPRLRIPVFADNDANLMALAESQLLSHKSSVIGITIGSGIGCGFIYMGRIFHGATGYGMELGHVTLVDNGDLCNCGRKGCLEAYAAVNGMRNRIKAKFPELNPVNMADVMRLGREYSVIQEIIEQGISLLSRAIANLAICLDADAIILGGGVVELSDYSTETLINKILDYLPEINKINLEIKRAEMGNSAGVMGAVILAEQNYSDG